MEAAKIERLKNEFSHLEGLYFNTAYFGPSPQSAWESGQKALNQERSPSFIPYESWRGLPDQVREKFAKLLGVSSEQISHHTSTGEVISLIATGFDFQAGDQVVGFKEEYPSDVLPWMVNQERFNFETVLLPSSARYDLDELAQKLPSKAKVLNVSHVAFNSGNAVDLQALGRLAKERDLFLVVDCSQSFGGVQIRPEELENIDVLTGCTYKWLLGPYGHGFAYWKPSAIEKVSRTLTTWLSSPNSYSGNSLLDYTTESLPGARRFDRGQAPAMLHMSLLGPSLDLLHEIGLDTIESHNRGLMKFFMENYPKDKFQCLTQTDRHAAIVVLKAQDGDALGLQNRLAQSKIDASVREGNLRLSFHLFNHEEELETLVEVLSSIRT